MRDIEKDEYLREIISHPGVKVLLEEIDAIINRMKGGVMSVTLDSDPQKSCMILLQERYKTEGALYLKSALSIRIEELKRRQT